MDRFGVAAKVLCCTAVTCATGRKNSVINATEDANAHIVFLGLLMRTKTPQQA
jgi:hypothetical protein